LRHVWQNSGRRLKGTFVRFRAGCTNEKVSSVKASNSQNPSDAQDGLSPDALNKRHREDSANRSQEDTPHKAGDPKDAGKQAEG
jgi:hypothetical protein